MRTFIYARISTVDQHTDNQVLAINNHGYDIPEHRVVRETVSGSVLAQDRVGLSELINIRMETGDTLVVLKLDRLGRDMIDVMTTLQLLQDRNISVISLDLGTIDLNSPSGKLQVQILSCMAEFERNRIRERTMEGLARARAQGKLLGRPVAVGTHSNVQELKRQGLSQSKVGAGLGISISTVKRHWH